MSNDHGVTFEPLQLKDGSGYYIRVTWPDGFVQQVPDFADEPEALDWIKVKSEDWLDRSPHKGHLHKG